MNYDLFDYAPVKNRKIFSIIKQLWSSINFKKIELDENNKMTVMTNTESKSLLKEQFEEITEWKVFRGKGTVSKLKMATTHDQIALKLETSPENEMIVIGSVPGQVSVLKPSIVVLVWTVAMNYNEMIMQPLVAVKIATPKGPKTIQLNMGRINEGMNTYVSYGDWTTFFFRLVFEKFYWSHSSREITIFPFYSKLIKVKPGSL